MMLTNDLHWCLIIIVPGRTIFVYISKTKCFFFFFLKKVKQNANTWQYSDFFWTFHRMLPCQLFSLAHILRTRHWGSDSIAFSMSSLHINDKESSSLAISPKESGISLWSRFSLRLWEGIWFCALAGRCFRRSCSTTRSLRKLWKWFGLLWHFSSKSFA